MTAQLQRQYSQWKSGTTLRYFKGSSKKDGIWKQSQDSINGIDNTTMLSLIKNGLAKRINQIRE